MEHGVVVTKYDKKGAAAQRVLFLDVPSMSVAWRDLDARPSSGGRGSPGHHRSVSFTGMLKGKKEILALAQLIEVQQYSTFCVDGPVPFHSVKACLRYVYFSKSHRCELRVCFCPCLFRAFGNPARV